MGCPPPYPITIFLWQNSPKYIYRELWLQQSPYTDQGTVLNFLEASQNNRKLHVSSATAMTINNFVRESNLWEQKQTKTKAMRGANLLVFNIDKRYFFFFNIDKRYLELH
jgi:hypothetical protein